MRQKRIAHFSFAILVIISYKKKIVNKNLNVKANLEVLNKKIKSTLQVICIQVRNSAQRFNTTTLIPQTRDENDNDCDYLRI